MLPLRRVWRIEHRDSCLGPFSIGCLIDYCVGSDRKPSTLRPYKMPSIYEDGHMRGPANIAKLVLDNGWRYGFPDLKTLLYWFDDDALLASHASDCVLRVYGVPWDQHTLFKQQIVYSRRHALLLRQISLDTLLDQASQQVAA